MSDESDFDDDIDKLLDEIDSAGTQKPKAGGSNTAKLGNKVQDAEGEKQADNAAEPKLTLKSDGNGFNINYGGSSGGFKLSDLKKGPQSPVKETGRSVRFPENPEQLATTAAAVGGGKPNFLSNLLGNNKESSLKSASEPAFPSSGQSGGNAAAKNLLQTSKSDWLGIGSTAGGNEDSLSPVPTPGVTKRQIGKTGGDTSGPNSLTMNKDDGNEEMLKSMGFDPKDPRGRASVPKGSVGGGSKLTGGNPRSGFDLDDDFWPKLGQTKSSSSGGQGSSLQLQPPESNFRSTLLQKAAASSAGQKNEPDSPFESLKIQQQTGPPSGGGSTKSIVDILPFLNKPKVHVQEREEGQQYEQSFDVAVPPPRSVSPAAPAQSAQAQLQGQMTSAGGKNVRVVKKTIQARSASPAVFLDRPTLQLPTHLVDEDELKSMCTSLKNLYGTQLEMQEKSYQEQMDCLVQSHHRKEELLREEIKIMHKEYDVRLERLKNELVETETKLPQRFHSELESMQRLHQQVIKASTAMSQGNFEISELHSPREYSTKAGVALPDFERIIEDKMNQVASSLVSAMSKAQRESSEGRQREVRDLEIKFDAVQKKLDTFAKFKLEEESRKNLQIIEAERKLQEEISKLNKTQKKIRESVVKAAVSAISQTLQMTHGEDSHKKEKISSQLKEFRKDVRRVLYDLEAKNDNVQRSHVSIEADQKQIVKILQEMQTQLQVNSARGNLMTPSMDVINLSHALSSKFPSPHFPNHQVQEAEMEIKMLREERNSLSESIAQMNVERRKMNEEKLCFEKDKMDLEREKNKLRDYEVQLRVKIAETEDMKKQSEEIRKKEAAKTHETSIKLGEMEKERVNWREQLHQAEQKLRIREGKLIQEKTELMREKDFVEKLRDQLLCPGCMKSINQMALISRSDGDGLDVSLYSSATVDASHSGKVPLPGILSYDQDSSLYSKENVYLEDLYYKQFYSKN